MEWINLKKLHYFYYVAKCGGYTEASRQLKIQQPALSKMVHSLEESIGMKLLQKQGRGIELTSQGRFVLEQCHKSFSHIRSIQEFSQHGDLLVKDSCKLAFADSTIPFFPEIAEAIKIQFPLLRLVLIQEIALSSVQKLARGELDFALLFHVPDQKSELSIVKRWPTKFFVVGSRAKSPNKANLKYFIGSREIESPDKSKLPVVQHLQKKWPDIQVHYSSNSLQMHLALVKAGHGISLLPGFMIEEDIKSGKLTKVIEETFEFDLKLVVGNSTKDKPWKQDLIGIVINQVNQVYGKRK